jgi:hypothetical protein
MLKDPGQQAKMVMANIRGGAKKNELGGAKLQIVKGLKKKIQLFLLKL